MSNYKRKIKLTAFLMIGLFIFLAGYFGYAYFYYGSRWFSDVHNTRVKVDNNSDIVLGNIYDRNKIVLAETISENSGKTRRKYHNNSQSYAHVVGFHRSDGRMGIEAFKIKYLLGYNNGLVEKIVQKAFMKEEIGNDIVLTIDYRLQELAYKELQNRKGSIVLINPQNGEILCMVSNPSFNLNDSTLNLDGDQLVNRATQGLYPPGSVFKIITAASGLKNIEDVENRIFECKGSYKLDNNTVVPCYNGETHGKLNLEDAMIVSCNSYFASLGTEIGWKNLKETAIDFGFNHDFLFEDVRLTDSRIKIDSSSNQAEIAWDSVGQGDVLVSPLHMAMVVSSIANRGDMMEPHLVYQVRRGRNDRILRLARSKVYKSSIDSSYAEKICTMLRNVVEKGTGKRADSDIVEISGKTGTAEIIDSKGEKKNDLWFVGFAPYNSPTLAIAVVIEEAPNGQTAGQVAVPIASEILEEAFKLGY